MSETITLFELTLAEKQKLEEIALPYRTISTAPSL